MYFANGGHPIRSGGLSTASTSDWLFFNPGCDEAGDITIPRSQPASLAELFGEYVKIMVEIYDDYPLPQVTDLDLLLDLYLFFWARFRSLIFDWG